MLDFQALSLLLTGYRSLVGPSRGIVFVLVAAHRHAVLHKAAGFHIVAFVYQSHPLNHVVGYKLAATGTRHLGRTVGRLLARLLERNNHFV